MNYSKKKVPVSNEQTIADYQFVKMGDMIKSLFVEMLNAHIQLKSITGKSFGNVATYEALKFYGLCPISDSVKLQMLEDAKKQFPDQEEDWIIEFCKVQSYNKYLQDMADYEMRVNEKVVPVENLVES